MSALGFQLPRCCMCFLSCQCAAFLVLRLLLSVPLSSQDDHRKYGPRWDANKTTVPAHHRCLCHASKHHAFGWTTNASGTSWSGVGCGWGLVRGLIVWSWSSPTFDLHLEQLLLGGHVGPMADGARGPRQGCR